jgi:hypothetical protein
MGELKLVVEELCGKPDNERLAIIKRHISELDLDFEEHKFLLGTHSNIFVDIPNRKNGEKRILIASHYDKVRGSPGANDNASAVATALGIAESMLEQQIKTPVRLAFFDLEEYNIFTSALYGSRKYVETFGVDNVKVVLNFELVGEGTIPIYWPVHDQSSQFISNLEKAAKNAGKKAHCVDNIIRNSGDHQSFSEAGIYDSVCLTLGCEEDRNLLQKAEQISQKKLQRNPDVLYNLNKQIFTQSRTFRNYHKRTDSSEIINEESLQLAKEIALQLIKQY